MTESLLRGLQAAPPDQRWVLWGPPEVDRYRWPSAEHVVTAHPPTQLSGQRDWRNVPPADLAVFLHQQRPLRRLPALSTILDTTPLRYNRNRLDALAKSRFLRHVGRISSGIITISDFSSRCIQRDLGVPAERITRIDLPADRDLAARVLDLRQASARREVALYVGLFLPHKNLPRLIRAFGRTTYRRHGGTLLLVGGKQRAEALRQTLDADQRAYVTIRPHCSQAELEELYATARFLVQPSLEEGFGLPVQEALAVGLPACVSDGGALPEVTRGFVEHFPATSEAAMAAAIDRTAEEAAAAGGDEERARSAAFLARTPTTGDLARQVRHLVDRHLPPAGVRSARPQRRGTR